MARERTDQSRHDGVARLVEAEREWQRRLDVARAEASATVAAAEVEARRRELAAAAHFDAVVASRRAAHQRATDDLVRGASRENAVGVARYTDASDVMIDALAERVAGTAPWFATEEVLDP